MANLFNYMGRVYTLLFREDLAIQYFLKSLKVYDKILNNRDGVAMNYVDIGNLYYGQENYEFASKYFNDALKLYVELHDEDGVATCYTNLGNVYADNKNISKGLNYYYKSIKIQEKFNFKEGLATNYNNIGDCYISLKQYNEAILYFDKAMKIVNENNATGLEIIIYYNLANLNIKQNNINKAIDYNFKSLNLSVETGDLQFQIENLQSLADNYDKIGNLKKSYEYLKKYNKLRDSVFEKEKRKNVGLFHALNELENKRLTIDELSSKNELAEIKYENEKKISYVLIILMTIFVVFLVISINLHTAKKKAYNLMEFKNHQINKMNEEIQQQTIKLKQLNSTKDKFFSIIAHDLKNPFNSIQGFTELLIDNYKEYSDEKKLKFLKIIKGSSLKASNLLSNLLLWANNQSGNLSFTPTKIELALLVSESISFVEIQAFNKEINIINNVDNHIFVYADENMINTVLRNLVSNSIKFTYSKGEIQIYSTIKEDFVEICVKDNGIGIAADEIENLFNIEIKNTSVGTANEHGSGLGLILCKDFVEKSGGKIWVESTPNVGSEFKFTLPIFKG
nr:tetratricopeptide repeat-containing sensor histidine kinase [Lutibacter sp.]